MQYVEYCTGILVVIPLYHTTVVGWGRGRERRMSAKWCEQEKGREQKRSTVLYHIVDILQTLKVFFKAVVSVLRQFLNVIISHWEIRNKIL